MAPVISPHFYRNISRTFLILLIVAGFGMALASVPADNKQVLGVSAKKNESINAEIEKTLKVIDEQPNYAGAWLRLSVLYGQLGEDGLSKQALETALSLNPDK